MSQQNVELARRAYEAFNRRDLDALLALTHDEVVVESRLVAIEGGYHGLEGMRRWWNSILEFIPDYTIEVEELSDRGEHTLARIRATGHGAGSATPLEETIWQPIKWRDGKCIWWRNFPSEAEALEAIGDAD
jgi:ketosteroid isomerase-like protein